MRPPQPGHDDSLPVRETAAGANVAQLHSTSSPAAHLPVPDSIPVISDEPPAAATAIGACPLTMTQQQVESNLDSLLTDLPEDAAAAEAHAAVALKLRPQPELMRALSLLARRGAAQPLLAQMVRKLVLLRLLVDTHLLNLTSSSNIEPTNLRAVSRSISTLVELVSALRLEFGTQLLDLQPRDAQQFNGLARALMPATDRLHSYGLLASMLEPLARAACDGSIRQVTHLKNREVERFTAGVQPGHEKGPAGRVILDTLALRCGMQADLESWQALPEPDPIPAAPGSDQNRDHGELPQLTGRHRELMERLQLEMSIYNVLLERIQYQQSATLASGDKAAFDEISSAQRILFSVYSQVAGVVRDPVPHHLQRDGDLETALDDLFDEVMESERNGEQIQSEEEVYLEALTEMRDAQRAEPSARMSAGVDPRKLRRRRQLLMVTAVVLAMVAAAVNYTLYSSPVVTPAPKLDVFAPAMPLDVAVPLGPVMYAEIPAFNWNSMSVEERGKRVALLGQLAQDKGFDAVLLVDESKTGLARWSRADGVTLAPASAVAAD
jgi:hypothetical protein